MKFRVGNTSVDTIRYPWTKYEDRHFFMCRDFSISRGLQKILLFEKMPFLIFRPGIPYISESINVV